MTFNDVLSVVSAVTDSSDSTYNVSQKNDTDVAHCNFDWDQLILVI